MGLPLKGTVHGQTVTLDVAVPSMEGMRVLVLLEPAEEPPLPVAEAEAAWKLWLELRRRRHQRSSSSTSTRVRSNVVTRTRPPGGRTGDFGAGLRCQVSRQENKPGLRQPAT